MSTPPDPLAAPARETPKATDESAPQASPRRYLIALAAGVVGALAAFYTGLFTLLATGNLPPPAFTNSLCIDEKLSFLREHGAVSPNLLVMGSSVAWRHFDGAAIEQSFPAIKPLNGGFCGLHVNQSAYAADWLLERYSSVQHVLMIAAPQDFAGCQAKPTEVFDREDVSDYVNEKASPWPYYIRYFAPGSIVNNARNIKARRSNEVQLDPLVFDRFASGPLDTDKSRSTLLYGTPDPLEPECFEALGELAERLHDQGRQLTVVSTPLHPEWKAKVDPDGNFRKAFNDQIAAALDDTHATYWDADSEWSTEPSWFTDAIHLRWSAVQDFTSAVMHHLAEGNRAAISDAHQNATLAAVQEDAPPAQP